MVRDAEAVRSDGDPPLTTSDEKREARTDANFYARFSNVAAGCWAGVALSQQGDPATAGVATLGVIGLLGVLGNDRRIVAQGIAEDPPRGDHDRVTRLRPEGISPAVLGRSAVGEAGADAAYRLSLVNLRLEAYLRALERAAGAKEAEDWENAADRAAEASHWGHRASERLDEYAVATRRLASIIAEQGSRTEPAPSGLARETPSELTFETLFDDSTLALLYRSGIPIRRLRELVRVEPPGAQPLRRFASLLSESARESEDYGVALRLRTEPRAPWTEEF